MDESGPSWTARRVAAHRLDFTRVPAPYGDAAADEALAGDVAGDLRITEGRLHEYLAARTAFFDRIVVGALDTGMQQVVIGGAGYDGRALRYARPGVRWFEVDHPATQADKRERLDRLGLDAAHVLFLAADFAADPVADRLLAAGLDANAPALFLLEGVAVYLEPAVVDAILDQFRQVAGPGSRLAISVSLSGEYDSGRAGFRASVAARGEPARSGFAADEAEGILARAGWLVTSRPNGAKDPEGPAAATRRRRLRAIGLLTAEAGPRTPPNAANQEPRTPQTPRRVIRTPATPLPQSPDSLSLSALLSQALVAFTIESDNEVEHRIPHRTQDYGASAQGYGAWLVSMAMYENCLKFVGDEPITVAELERLARTGTNLDGMRRWSYITIDGTAKKIHKSRPGPGAVLCATERGLQARQAWTPVAGLTEQRWRERFGPDQVARLKDALLAVVTQLDSGLPDCLPILGANLTSRGPDPALPPRPAPVDLSTLPLSALMSRVLLSFALDYERESALSLPVGANLLRVLSEEGIRLRDLPGLTGISKEAVSWALGILVRARLAAEEPDPGASRGKVALLTPGGTAAQRAYQDLLAATEERWRDRFGAHRIAALRQPLEALAAVTEGRLPLLFGGLEPYPDGWRARVRPPVILPYFPMVLHRGGYPDGS
jgi:methyltransferase (TIGR00027 family)